MRLFGIFVGVCVGMNLFCSCEKRRRVGVFQRKVQIRGEETKRKLHRNPRKSFSICTFHIVSFHLSRKKGWNRRHVGVKKNKGYTCRKYNAKGMQSSVSDFKVTRREILTSRGSSS